MTTRVAMLACAIMMPLGLQGCANQPDPVQGDQRLFLTVVRGLQDSGRHNAALAYLNDYRRNFPGDPEATLLTAEALLGLNRVPEAAELFASLTSIPAVAARAYWGLGRSYAAVSRWDDAIQFLEKASYTNPSEPRFLNDLGFAHIMVDRPDLAFHYLAQAADLSPEDDLIMTNLLLAAHRSGRAELVKDSMSRIKDAERRADIQKFILEWQPSAVQQHRRVG